MLMPLLLVLLLPVLLALLLLLLLLPCMTCAPFCSYALFPSDEATPEQKVEQKESSQSDRSPNNKND